MRAQVLKPKDKYEVLFNGDVCSEHKTLVNARKAFKECQKDTSGHRLVKVTYVKVRKPVYEEKRVRVSP